MAADILALLQSLADPRVMISVLPLFLLFGTAAAVILYSLYRTLTGFPPATAPALLVRPAPHPAPAPVATPASEATKEPSPELLTKLEEAGAQVARLEIEVVQLTDKLKSADSQVQHEQTLRAELQTKAEALANQFEEVIHEVEHIYHQNVGVSAFEELTQRILRIREGQALGPRGESSGAGASANENPEKLLIAEQAGEIRKLKEIVSFYKEKYGG